MSSYSSLTRIHTRTYKCASTDTHTHTHTQTHTLTYTRTKRYKYMHKHTHTHTHTDKHTHTNKHTHRYTHTQTHTHTHRYTHNQVHMNGRTCTHKYTQTCIQCNHVHTKTYAITQSRHHPDAFQRFIPRQQLSISPLISSAYLERAFGALTTWPQYRTPCLISHFRWPIGGAPSRRVSRDIVPTRTPPVPSTATG